MRINKFIANNSKFSRRKADELIANGKVFLNGKPITELGTDVDPEKDQIKIDNQLISSKNSQKVYLALNKPRGYITSREDPFGRKTVMELVPKIDNLKSVGRLDYETEGLLLFSNDGKFINKHTHPSYETEKEYFVKIKGKLSEENQNHLEKGVLIEGKKTSPAKIIIIKKSPAQSQLKITIHEGRNRQIRKIFDYIGHPVQYLCRIRIGKIELKDLPKGTFRYLTKEEINDY